MEGSGRVGEMGLRGLYRQSTRSNTVIRSSGRLAWDRPGAPGLWALRRRTPAVVFSRNEQTRRPVVSRRSCASGRRNCARRTRRRASRSRMRCTTSIAACGAPSAGWTRSLGHLEVIRPTVAHQFKLGNILTLDRPRFDRGFVTFRRGSYAGFEVLTYVEMFYSVIGTAPFIFRVNPGCGGRHRGAAARLGDAVPLPDRTGREEGRALRPLPRAAVHCRLGAFPAGLCAADHRGHAAQRRPLRVGPARIPARQGRRVGARGPCEVHAGRGQRIPAPRAALAHQAARRRTAGGAARASGQAK